MGTAFNQKWVLVTIFAAIIVGLGTLHFAFSQDSGEEESVALATLEATAPPAPTLMATATDMPTSTDTATIMPTATDTATVTPLPTDTATSIPTATVTPLPTETATDTPTVTNTATVTPLPTETATDIPTVTNTATDIPTMTATATVTPLPTETATDIPTLTATATVTPLPTDTATDIPTATDTATVTPLPTETATDIPTLTATATITPLPTETATSIPTATDTASDIPTVIAMADVASAEITETMAVSGVAVNPTAHPDVATVVPETTEEIATAEVQQFQITGSVAGLAAGTHVTIALLNVDLARTDVFANNQYEYSLANGHYRLTIVVPYHLPVILEFDVRDADLQLPTLQLTAGDFDGNGAIDSQDAQLLIRYYGQSVANAPHQMDLNGDGLINLLDLSILTASFQTP